MRQRYETSQKAQRSTLSSLLLSLKMPMLPSPHKLLVGAKYSCSSLSSSPSPSLVAAGFGGTGFISTSSYAHHHHRTGCRSSPRSAVSFGRHPCPFSSSSSLALLPSSQLQLQPLPLQQRCRRHHHQSTHLSALYTPLQSAAAVVAAAATSPFIMTRALGGHRLPLLLLALMASRSVSGKRFLLRQSRSSTMTSRPSSKNNKQQRERPSSSTKLEMSTLVQSPPISRGKYNNKDHDRRKDDDVVNTQKGKAGEGGRATIISSVFNLVNNVAGAGILTLSAGMSGGTGWIPAIVICSVLGCFGAHTFSIIGEACELTGESDFKGLWSRTIGTKSTYIVDTMIATMCLACAVIYSGILGDVFTPLLAQLGVPSQFNGRTSNILALTAGLLLPLSLIKDLSALAFTSVLGFAAIMYTVIFILIRAFDGSYKLGTGKFVLDGLIVAQPSFLKSSLWNFDFTSLVLASNLGLAYIAHYNGPNFYRSLKDTNSKRFRKMVNIAFTMLVALYVVTMAAGYSTFGDACQGNILLNYHPEDILSTLGRLATGLSILFGFPLVACGARESIVGAAASLGFDQLGAPQHHFWLVSGILAFVTTISCAVKDVSLVVGLTGAALGSAIVYICPVIIYAKAVGLVRGYNSIEYQKARRNLAFVPFGLFIAGLGCYMTLAK